MYVLMGISNIDIRACYLELCYLININWSCLLLMTQILNLNILIVLWSKLRLFLIPKVGLGDTKI